jgi:hypothetical protein
MSTLFSLPMKRKGRLAKWKRLKIGRLARHKIASEHNPFQIFEHTKDWVPVGFGNLAGMTKF